MNTIINGLQVITCILLLTINSAGWGRVIEDFDLYKLSDRWTASSGMVLTRSIVPNTVIHEGVGGRILKVEASAGGYFATKSNFPNISFDLFKDIKFRLNAKNVSSQNPIIFEFQVFATDRKAWRWRKVEIKKSGWQTVVLPLRFFRHSPATFLKWENTRRFAFRFRNSGKIEFDKIELIKDSFNALSSKLSPEELCDLAFGKNGKVYRSGKFFVISDVAGLESDKILSALETFDELFSSDFPEDGKGNFFVPLLIFKSKKSYQEFWAVLSGKFNSSGPVPNSDGYAMLGIAGSYFDSEYGLVRPVYIHEVCHALIARRFGIASQGGWLQEGLANYYQLKWGEKDTSVYAKNLLTNRRLVPLANLLDGSPVGMRNYAQVVLFYEWILATRKDRIEDVIRGVVKQGSSNLEPLAQAYLGQSIVGLEKEWIQWLKSR